MIPQRIYVQGFLCYREAQQACFEGCSLWLLSGPNGSGKSALFDAVTYALYGQHRAGRHNARGLINKDSESLVVEFDFLVDEVLYRARRLLARDGRPLRQMYRWQSTSQGSDSGCWQEIADTNSEQGFARWVADHVALTYEMFTASVLLLQGRAESLLQAGPSQRHQLLAQIVGLDRYAELQQRAQRHAAASQAVAARLGQQVHAISKTTPRQLHEAQRAAQRARVAQAEAAKTIAALQHLLAQAEQWEQLQGEQLQLRQRGQQLAQILHDGPEVQSAYRRWEVLHCHWDELAAMAQRRQAARDFRHRREQLDREHAELRRQESIAAEALAATLAEIERTQLSLHHAVAAHGKSAEQHASLSMALEVLKRLYDARVRLGKSWAAADQASRQLRELQTAAERLTGGLPSAMELSTARSRAQVTAQQLAEAAASRSRTAQQLERFRAVSGEQVCPWCRQPLPETHVARQLASLEREAADIQLRCQQAQQTASAAQSQLTDLENRTQAAGADLSLIGSQIGNFQGQCEVARQMGEDGQRLCHELHNELPETFRLRVGPEPPSDWTMVTYPADADLRELTQTKEQLAHQAMRWAGEIASLQRELALLRARQESQSVQRQRLSGRIDALGTQVAELQEASRCWDRADEACAAEGSEDLSPWMHLLQSTTLTELSHQREALEQAGVSAQYQRLCQARADQRQLEIEQGVIQCRLAALGPEVGRDTAGLRRRVDAAGRELSACDQAVQETSAAEMRLAEVARRRQELAVAHKQADRQRHLWSRLAGLLGCDGLQRDLVRHAERAIVDCANAILDRISAGQLYLELSEEPDEQRGCRKALNLLARTSLGSGSTLQYVAFLSGSQKFRVAVSLCLAIGQYASGARRPVQSVIIDEGFGCLDTVNRQVMIQELQNLRNHLRRIILVSHQDEFASALADGYRCELIRGASRLERLHR